MSSVIIAGAIIGGAMGAGSGIYGISKGNRQLIKAFKKQMYYAQLNYNYNQAELTKQQTSMYHSAVSELASLSYNAYLNNASVQAAQAQTGYQGRTANAISRTIKGQTARQKTAVKDQYQNSVANVRAQKQALYISMKNEVQSARQNLSNQFTHGFQAFMSVLDSTAKGAAAGALGGAAVGALGSVGSTATSAGAATASSTGTAAASGASAATTATTAASTASTTAASSGSWLANFNTLMTQNESLFKGLQFMNMFTSGMSSKRGGYYQ